MSASDNGLLIYLSGGNRETDSHLVWFDRSGKALSAEGVLGRPVPVSLSPDEKTAAILRRQAAAWPGDLWLRDMSRASEVRFTSDGTIAGDGNVVWSPDGSRIAFSSFPSGSSKSSDVYIKTDLLTRDIRGSGQVQPVIQDENHKNATDWSSDGLLLYTEISPKTGADLWYVRLDKGGVANAKPVSFLQTQFDESFGQISPDSHWIAYLSNESGDYEVYVRPFPTGTEKWKVSASTGGGFGTQQPRWNPNGKELFYLTGTAGRFRLMSVSIAASKAAGPTAALEIGAPKLLFEVRANGYHPASSTFFYSVSKDGQRFLINHVDSSSEPVLNVVVNWQQALQSAK